MRDGINFSIEREVGAGTFLVNAYRFGSFCGTLRGHLDNRSGIIKLYPHARLAPGMFHTADFPIVLRFCEIPYERQARA